MTNIFIDAPEFITKDNRRLRAEYTTSVQSITNRLEAQLPKVLIKDKTILDLGSCLGAAGHYSLYNGASHYTGVELQKFYANTSIELLNRYNDPDKFQIIIQDLITFLDQCITTGMRFDITVAAGILYEFMDPIAFLQKVCKVTNETVVVDTKWIRPGPDGMGVIAMRPTEAMVRGTSADEHSIIRGIGSRMCVNAIDIVMSTECYYRDKDRIFPAPISDTEDPYNVEVTHPGGHVGPKKIILRYTKGSQVTKTLNDKLNEKAQYDNF